MTQLFLLPFLYLAADTLWWKYYKRGPAIFSELAKVAMVLLVVAGWYAGTLYAANPHFEYIIAGVLFHFVIQQVGCGIIRQGNPLYLGVGLFDRFIRFVTGGTWYMYVLLLGACTFVGIHLILTA